MTVRGASSPVLDVGSRVLAAEHTQHDQHEHKEEQCQRHEDSVHRHVANDAVTVQDTALLDGRDGHHIAWDILVEVCTQDFLRMGK